MSDAWNAPGWTAQQSATYYTEGGTPGSWRLPADVDTVRIHGSYGDMDGGRPDGYILIEGNASLKHAATKTIVLQPHYYCLINRDGTFDVEVPATDSPALVSASPPFTYTITVVLGRRLVTQFSTALPLAQPDVSLFDLMPNV